MDCVIPRTVILSLLFIAVIIFKEKINGLSFSQTNKVNKSNTFKDRIMIHQLRAANSILEEHRMVSFSKAMCLISSNRILL